MLNIGSTNTQNVFFQIFFFKSYKKIFFPHKTFSISQFVSDNPRNSVLYHYWTLDSCTEANLNVAEWCISDNYLFTRNVSAKMEGLKKSFLWSWIIQNDIDKMNKIWQEWWKFLSVPLKNLFFMH